MHGIVAPLGFWMDEEVEPELELDVGRTILGQSTFGAAPKRSVSRGHRARFQAGSLPDRTHLES
jgi:hypothetical protein